MHFCVPSYAEDDLCLVSMLRNCYACSSEDRGKALLAQKPFPQSENTHGGAFDVSSLHTMLGSVLHELQSVLLLTAVVLFCN